eukprot:TRINITY_DN1519_c0_g5_i2.p1 TRINITY_DN1519_c0_g5~~TRINITY_DN1519_c0_g5_i2.p1  ORF type:complete len:181 (-),score=42.54 TRINITY_DN1519_c0_g5_i2:27-569(-)
MRVQVFVVIAILFALGSSFQIYDQCDRRWGLTVVANSSGETLCENYRLGSFYTIIASVFADAKKPCGNAPVCTPDVLAKTLDEKKFRKNFNSLTTDEFNFDVLASLGLKLIGCTSDRKQMVKNLYSGGIVIANDSPSSEYYWVLVRQATERHAIVASPRNIYKQKISWLLLHKSCTFKWI